MTKGMTCGVWVAMVAMLAACSGHGGDGPAQEDIRDALARDGAKVQSAERIACKAAPDKPGYVCDFRAVTCSRYNSKCSKSLIRTARFVNVSGTWMFMGDISSPTRGYDAAPEPGPSPTVTDISPAPTPTSTPSSTASPQPSPTATPTASPVPKPADKPTPAPSPKPTPKVTPKPTATPTSAPETLPTPTASPIPLLPPGYKANAAPAPIPTGVNSAWLRGRWAHDEDACSAKRAVKFGGGGTFFGKRGPGRWTLKGKTVAVQGTDPDNGKPFDQSLSVERTGDNAMTMEGRRYHRCIN